MEIPMAEVCAYCKKIIMKSEPVREHGKPFCNHLCATGFEADQRLEKCKIPLQT